MSGGGAKQAGQWVMSLTLGVVQRDVAGKPAGVDAFAGCFLERSAEQKEPLKTWRDGPHGEDVVVTGHSLIRHEADQ